MLFRFKSKVTGDLLLLDPHGRRILKVMGKADEAQGIIQTKDMPGCILALEKAIEEEARQLAESNQNADATPAGLKPDQEGEDPDKSSQGVSFKHRALPMLNMLRACQKAEVPIVWGV